MKKQKRRAVIARHCVACGACMKECPTGALSIRQGVIAEVNDKCLACGKCVIVCPANAISLIVKEAPHA